MAGYHSKERIDRQHGLTQGISGESYKMSYQGQGTGAWSLWHTFVKNQDKAIQQFESTEADIIEKEFIRADVIDEAIESNLGLISTMTEHYKVHLWTGKQLTVPLADSSAFWKRQHEIQITHKKLVREQLIKWGYDPNKYIIFGGKQVLQILNLTKIPINAEKSLQDILDQYRAHNITTVQLVAPTVDEIQRIQNTFPGVTFEIVGATQEWLDYCSSWEKTKRQKLFAGSNLLFLDYKSETIVTELSAKEIKIQVKPELKQVHFISRDHELESFVLDSKDINPHLSVKLENVSKLKVLDVKKCENTKELLRMLPRIETLETLRIGDIDSESKHDPLAKFPNLKECELKNTAEDIYEIDSRLPLKKIKSRNSVYVTPASLPQLEELCYVQFAESNPVCSKLKKLFYTDHDEVIVSFDEKHFPELELLELFECDGEHFDSIPSLTHLKSLLMLNLPKIQTLSLPSSLEILTLRFVAALKKLTIPKDAKCRKIVIQGSKLNDLDLSAHPSLSILNLEDNPDLEKLALPSSLIELKIKNCKKLTAINLSHLELLNELTLEGIESFKHWNIAKFPKLTTLNLTNITLDEKETMPNWGDVDVYNLSWNADKMPFDYFAVNGAHKHITIDLDKKVENNFVSLKIEKGEKLETLTLRGCSKLSMLDLSACQNLRVVTLKESAIKTFPSAELPFLEELNLESCDALENIDFALLPNLKRLTIKSMNAKLAAQFSKLQLPKLESLTIMGARIPIKNWDHLDLTACPHLKLFSIERINVNKITLSPELESVKLNEVMTNSIEFLYASKIKKFEFIKSHGNLLNFDMPLLTQFTLIADTPFQLLNRNYPSLQQLKFEIDSKEASTITGLDKCAQLRCAELRFVGAEAVKLPDSCVSVNKNDVSRQESKVSDIPAEKRKFHLINSFNPVSCLSLEDKARTLTAFTGKPRAVKYLGDIRVTLTKKGGAHKEFYRWKIRDKIEVKGTTIDFKTFPICEDKTESRIWQNFSKAKFLELEEKAKTYDDIVLGHLHADMEFGKRYPLAAGQALDYGDKGETMELYCNSKPPVKIKRIWDREKQQFYVELDEKVRGKVTVDFLYVFQNNRVYNDYPDPKDTDRKLVRDEKLSFPPELRVKILNAIRAAVTKHGEHPLAFLLDEPSTMPLEQEIYLATQYCKGFDNQKALTFQKNDSDFDKLATVIAAGIGSCKHRTQALMTIAHMRGVPARYLQAEGHASIEMPFQAASADKPPDWRNFNLGGSPVIDETPRDRRIHLRDYINDVQIKSKSSTLFTPEQKQPYFHTATTIEEKLADTKRHERIIDEIYKRLTEPTPVNSAHELLDAKTLLSPLIELTAQQKEYDVNKYIVAELKKQNKLPGEHYQFINSPRDFDELLHTYQIKDGKRSKIDGPLVELIKKKDAIILVNWANFTIDQIASYKSILDTTATLKGKEVNARIIGLTRATQEVYPPLLSRCQPFSCTDAFFSAAETKDEKPVPSSIHAPVEIHLFNRHDWHETIYGEILPGENIKLNESRFIQAVRDNIPVVIYGMPVNEELVTLIRRIRDEKKFWYNGELISVPEGFTIKIDKAKPLSESNATLVEHGKEEKRNLIYLTLNDFHRLFKEVVSDEKNEPSVKSGLLEKYRAGVDIFYFTESIPLDKWHELLHFSQEKKIAFDFMLAPGVKVAKHKGPEPAPPQIKQSSETVQEMPSVILSNDPDFMCTQLQTQFEARVFHVAPHHHFGNLMAGRMPEFEGDQVKLRFKMSPLLQALIAGKNIILTGSISSSLYRQLLPLLANKEIECNGKTYEIKGKLKIVVSNTLGKSIKPFEAVQCNYELNDYLAVFPKDKKHIEDIYRFILQAKKLPHTGIGTLKQPPELSYELIKSMLQLLRNKDPNIHPHNPLKSTIFYHYDKEGEHYAYLNVMAKIIFHSADDKEDKPIPVDMKKLNKLYENYSADQLYQDHLWKLLNCFNVTKLKTIFKDDYLKAITPNGFPSLKPEILAEFRLMVEKEIADQHAAAVKGLEEKTVPKRLHVDKRNKILHTYLADKNCQIITLVGLAGVGKSEVKNELEKDEKSFKVYDETKIIEWLTNPSQDVTKILFIDELNTATPDTYRFLEDLRRGLEGGELRQVTYKDVSYKLDARHKILATANPTSYAGRYHHDLLIKYGRSIYFKMPDDESIKKMLNEIKPLPDELHHVFLSAFHWARKINSMYTYSLRDIISAVKRFNTLSMERSVAEALKACKIEFLGTFDNASMREKYLKKLEAEFKIPLRVSSESPIYTFEFKDRPNLYYPADRAYIIEAIEHDLAMRAVEIKSPGSLGYYKKMVLLEGAPGLGKSTLYEAILLRQGFSKKNPPESGKKYYVISQDNEGQAEQILLEAFREGAVVILDEINVNPNLEKLINKIVTEGKVDGVAVKRPGCVILGSDNPGISSSLKTIAASFLNRCHVFQMPLNTPAELIAVAKKYGAQHADVLVKFHQEYARRLPDKVNTRTFFTALMEYIAKVNLSQRPAEMCKFIKDLLLATDTHDWPSGSDVMHWIKSLSNVHQFFMLCVEEKNKKLSLANLKKHLLVPGKSVFDEVCYPENIASEIINIPWNENKHREVARVLDVYSTSLRAQLSQSKSELYNFYGVILARCIDHSAGMALTQPLREVARLLKNAKIKPNDLETLYKDLILLLESGVEKSDKERISKARTLLQSHLGQKRLDKIFPKIQETPESKQTHRRQLP